MKRYINVIGLLCCLFFWNSCTDEEYANNTIEEGIPVDAKLLFTTPEMQQVQTKTDMGTAAENTVKDLQVFIFKETGNLEKQYSFVENDLKSLENQTSGAVALSLPGLTSGEKKIVAIANLSSSSIDGNLQLDNIENLEQLEKEVVTIKTRVQRPDAMLMMSGYYGISVGESLEKGGLCSLDSKNAKNGIVTLTGKIWLRHLDSKIKFEVKVSGDRTEFIPKDWQVFNVPKKSYLLPNTEDAAQSLKEDFFTQEGKDRFDVLDIEEGGKYQGGSFVFYMNENRKDVKEKVPSDEYKWREYKTTEGGRPEQPFKYADDRSTYVVLRGSYYKYDEYGKLVVSADVRYTIHLGYVDNAVSDFDSERNKSYTYNVQIKGVDDIILEVESSKDGYDGGFKENQPGAEGDVIKPEQNLLLDAHYEVQTIVFYKDKLNNLSVMVRTPYESSTSIDSKTGTFQINEAGAQIDYLKDFEWVEFAKSANSNFVSYADAYRNRELKNIKEVLEELYEHKNDADNSFWGYSGKVYYTVFVNEYYYDKNPLKENTPASWKDFVNAENRQMHILCNTLTSKDEQSSLTKSSIMIDQRSIKSIYNVENQDLQSAWGIETVEETGRRQSYIKGGNGYAETKTNGRYNMFKFMKNRNASKTWGDYMNFSTNMFSPSNSDRNYAEYVCLQRNRDLNGDGVIDDKEIRWYLPATNQLIGLWIGQDALPSDARLLQVSINGIEKGNPYENHLISSNGIRFWTEEGCSTGNTAKHTNNFRIRCARNLGKTNEKPSLSDEPQDYVEVKRYENGIVKSVDLSRVSSLALRTETYGAISFHTEHTGGDLNHPHKDGFNVYKTTSSGTFSVSKDENGSATGTLSGCPKGYRVPNQRELALIGGYSTSLLNNLASCTYSALTYKYDLFILVNDGKENYLNLYGSSTSAARCVKDGK